MSNDKKTVIVQIDWLSRIDGYTVSDAIKYLQSLDQDNRLAYSMVGDTHGCEVISSIHYDVELSDSEMLKKREKYLLEQIAIYEKAKLGHISFNRPDRVDSCERLIAQLQGKLADARVKYGKKD